MVLYMSVWIIIRLVPMLSPLYEIKCTHSKSTHKAKNRVRTWSNLYHAMADSVNLGKKMS